MKHFKLYIWMMMAGVLLTGCANQAIETEVPGASVDKIETLVYQTAEARITMDALSIPSETPYTAPTQMPSPTNTLIPSPTAAVIASATPYTVVYAPVGCDNASYIADVTIPDYSIINAGEEFIKTWSLQNSGTCSWTENYSLNYVSGELMAGVNTAVTITVLAGETEDISVSLTAPLEAGEYSSYWQMVNAEGSYFGDMIYVVIVVSDDATITHTPTPTSGTPTASSTPADTPTSTPVSEATATQVNTEVPTSTAVHTSTALPTSVSISTPVPTETALPVPTETEVVLPSPTPEPEAP